MPQNEQSIVNSQEFKDFCKNNNLDVLNIESINLALYNLNVNNYENVNGFFEHDKRIYELEEENNKLREMIMEIAKYVQHGYNDGVSAGFISLFDKWNNK